MATVNKDFRIKSGLVVEGANATVNGEDIITTGSTTDDLAEGTSNLYFTAQRAADAVADEISTAVDTAINNLTTTDIEEGSNQYFTEQRVLDTVSGNLGTGIVYSSETAGNVFHIDENVVSTRTYADNAASTAASTAQTNAQSYADTAAYNAQMNAEGYVDAQLTNYTTTANLDNTIDGLGYLKSADLTGYATETYADSAANTAEDNANTYTDTALGSYTPTANLDTTIDGYGYLKSADLSGYATESYVGTAIDNLVDGAPGLLDTLNEIAAAINDDANYATTITTALAGKQNSLTAGDNISIVSDTISVTGLAASDISDFNTAALSATASAYDAAGAAATAEQNAKDYADLNFVNVDDLPGQLDDYVPLTQKGANDGVATLDSTGQVPLSQLGNVPEDYITGLKSGESNLEVTSGELSLKANVTLNSANFSAKITHNGTVYESASGSFASGPSSVHQFPLNTFDAVKYLVKAKNGSGDRQISEILIAVDGSGNVAITEFGNVETNVSLASFSANKYSDGKGGYYVALEVTPASGSVDVRVFATMFTI